jgi:exportin-2 (importin alpha re-exporter)
MIVQTFVGTLNDVQCDMFSIIMDQISIPYLVLMTEGIELKLIVVASTILICESLLLNAPNAG